MIRKSASILDNKAMVVSIIGALLVGKWLAVELARRSFGYSRAARQTMWSLTLPQVAATLVAFDTLDPAGHRLVDGKLLNAVLVLMLTTAILGPVLTERFAPRILDQAPPHQPANGKEMIAQQIPSELA